MTNVDAIRQALALPNGARFYHCALQVNPFEYAIRHSKKTPYTDEASYNTAMVKALLKKEIEVIAITDHHRIQTAESLAQIARESGIYVFPGFEAVTKDGVHLLCLFDPEREVREMDRILGDCGIHCDEAASSTGKYDTTEFLKIAADTWGAVCVAAHIASEGGLLKKLSGQTRIKTWRCPDLCACALPGPVCDAPNGIRQILENKNADYRKERLIAVINAQDISSPEDISKLGTSCWIKMSEISVEGLRQAFLDPASRIRLTTDPKPEDHDNFLALSWQGGFLDGVSLHFNDNLNVLIGGRGTGKSTVVESLRYVLGLDPIGDDTNKAHEGIVKNVLRNGTKISLLVRAHKPSQRDYLIERTIPNPVVLREVNGDVLSLSPRDVMPQVEIYGQHEISELTKSPEKLTGLLKRFVEHDSSLNQRKCDLQSKLESNRSKVVDLQAEQGRISEQLAALPALEETLRRFQEAGIESRLKEQSFLVKEEKMLKTASEKLDSFRSLVQQLQKLIPIDRNFLSSEYTRELPGKEILAGADSVLEQFDRSIQEIVTNIILVINTADAGLANVKIKWKERESTVKEEYEKILRELQKSNIDGGEFIQLRRQIEDLNPRKDRQESITKEIESYLNQRHDFLIEWEDIKAQEFRELENAAKKVNRKLKDRVRVSVAFAGNRKPLGAFLREKVGGRLAEAIDVLERQDDLSLPDLVSSIRSGKDALSKKYGIALTQADRIAQIDQHVVMKIEELDLPSTTKIELNVTPDNDSPEWRALEELSTGQKATAILLLLLLESKAPLIVDQPEDDLDNRFIAEGIVPRMKEEKCRRQFVFTTHNANIPVLGDAELIVGFTASGEGDNGKAKIPKEHMGSIDELPVRELVEEVLEGGKNAFEMRRKKYGF